MRRSSLWLAPAAALFLFACYAELPGSADVDGLDAGGLGGVAGGTTGSGFAGGTLGGGTPGGSMSDAGGGSSEAGPAVGCDGVGVGTTQQRIRYASVQVVSPDTCKSEVQSRTCGASGFSAWSGSYQAETCSVGTLRSCGATASGQSETRQRYPVDETDDASDCQAETQMRVCTDGTWGEWSGDAEFESCHVSFLGTCGVSGLFTGNMCAANTTCKVKGLTWPRCLGNAGHDCDANGDCIFTCVSDVCTAADPARGGACDDAADCANALCPNASGGSGVAGCVANACVCPNNSLCTANNQCSGTCVAQSVLLSTCVTTNTTCDNNDDCRNEAKCVKMGQAVSGSCVLPDGKGPCTTDAQCEHICRAGTCSQPGQTGESCAENADCKGMLVCRQVGLNGPQCATQGGIGEFCDELADCGGNTTCGTTNVGGITTMMCLGGPGSACTTAAAAYQCASGVCIPCTMGPECTGTIGTCQ